MIFNPITNQPFRKDPNEKNNTNINYNEFNGKNIDFNRDNTNVNREQKFVQMQNQQKEPVEYNPYKNPYSQYQGRP